MTLKGLQVLAQQNVIKNKPSRKFKLNFQFAKHRPNRF